MHVPMRYKIIPFYSFKLDVNPRFYHFYLIIYILDNGSKILDEILISLNDDHITSADF